MRQTALQVQIAESPSCPIAVELIHPSEKEGGISLPFVWSFPKSLISVPVSVNALVSSSLKMSLCLARGVGLAVPWLEFKCV